MSNSLVFWIFIFVFFVIVINYKLFFIIKANDHKNIFHSILFILTGVIDGLIIVALLSYIIPIFNSWLDSL